MKIEDVKVLDNTNHVETVFGFGSREEINAFIDGVEFVCDSAIEVGDPFVDLDGSHKVKIIDKQ